MSQRRHSRGQLVVAAALLLVFLSVDAPAPWATPLYYHLSFDIEPWHGPQGLERARADLAAEGLTPGSLEVVPTLTWLVCLGTGCKIGKALRATFTWPQVLLARERCFSYEPLRLALLRRTAFDRDDCRPIHEVRPP